MARMTVGTMGLSNQSLNEMEKLIQSCKTGSREFDFAMHVAAEMMANLTKGYAQRLYRGPQVRASFVSRGLAPSSFSIPVRRITGRTYAGWRVKMIRRGAWETYTEERGAYMVEFGIVRGGGGKRRPILKMAGIQALRTAQRSNLGHRIYGKTWGELQMNRGQFSRFGRTQGQVYLT